MKVSGFKSLNVGVAIVTLGLAFGCSSDQQQQEEDQLETSEDTGEFGGDFSAADETLDTSVDGDDSSTLGALPDGMEGGDAGMDAAPAAAGSSAPGDFQQGDVFEYVVVSGDSLSAIAMRVFGTYQKWHDIQALTNRPNPNLIYPGNVVRIPLSDAGAVEWARSHRHLHAGTTGAQMTNSQAQTVTVQSGDTLSSISKQYFGTDAKWRQIWDQNRDVVANPNSLAVGTQLQVSAPAH